MLYPEVAIVLQLILAVSQYALWENAVQINTIFSHFRDCQSAWDGNTRIIVFFFWT